MAHRNPDSSAAGGRPRSPPPSRPSYQGRLRSVRPRDESSERLDGFRRGAVASQEIRRAHRLLSWRLDDLEPQDAIGTDEPKLAAFGRSPSRSPLSSSRYAPTCGVSALTRRSSSSTGLDGSSRRSSGEIFSA